MVCGGGVEGHAQGRTCSPLEEYPDEFDRRIEQPMCVASESMIGDTVMSGYRKGDTGCALSARNAPLGVRALPILWRRLPLVEPVSSPARCKEINDSPK